MRHFIDRFWDTRVYVLINKKTGDHDGRIFVKFSREGNAEAGIISCKLNINLNKTGKATGHGYDKISASIATCLRKHGFEDAKFGGAGEISMFKWFNDNGLSVRNII